MEVHLQNLLESIKKEGVEAAEREALMIIDKARNEAEIIISAARKQAEDIEEQAQLHAERFENTAKDAVRQAGRDLLISVQIALQESFDRIVQKTVSESFTPEALTHAIVDVVKSFQADGRLEISPKDFKVIESSLRFKLGTEIEKGLELRINNLIDGGFILKERGGKSYYDFSSQSIAEAIKSSLSQRIADLVSIKK